MRPLPLSLSRRVLGAAITCAAAVGQHANLPDRYDRLPYELDSGWVEPAPGGRRVAYRGRVQVPRASWLRLDLRGTHLDPGSVLRLASVRDAAAQRFDAHSLADYAFGSAYFNGGAVAIELEVAAGTRSRVRVVAVDAGWPGPATAAESTCGGDDRLPSQDPRVGRQHPGGCTAWLVDEFTVVTAGHCNPAGRGIHFNVPLSTAGGQIQLPHPDDQYVYDSSTVQLQNLGIGEDWAVVAAVKNSNTGLYPGQAQGSWFALGAVPASASQQPIRVTGYGTVSGSVSPTWNQVQKSDAGPLQSVATNWVRFVVDVTGGNSGSPIILDQSDEAIGIVTHCPCPNWGTRIDRAVLQAALQAVMASKTAGRFRRFGQGCAGSAGQARLDHVGFPVLGQPVTLQARNLAPNRPMGFLFGTSATTWAGGALPRDLTGYGLSGCSQYHDWGLGAVPGSTGSGTASHTIAVPSDAALVGAQAFLQAVALDPLANPFGVVTTDAAELVVGTP